MSQTQENNQWTPRVKATHSKMNGVRFVAGELVMLSKKNITSGNIPYFLETNDLVKFDLALETKDKNSSLRVLKSGDLERGIPILLIEDPKLIKTIFHDTEKPSSWFRTSKTKYNLLRSDKDKNPLYSWLIRFILDGKIYRMYLKKNQYNCELVRAVPGRIKKNYRSRPPRT